MYNLLAASNVGWRPLAYASSSRLVNETLNLYIVKIVKNNSKKDK